MFDLPNYKLGGGAQWILLVHLLSTSGKVMSSFTYYSTITEIIR